MSHKEPEAGDISDVSRETWEKIELFETELLKWSKAINLIGPSTANNAMSRHIADSLQIIGSLTTPTRWVDFGSGGGLPAIPLAIVASEKRPDLQFFLVESDKRKAAFLQLISHKLSLNVAVLNERAEGLQPIGADIVSARAFAPLKVILELASRHLVKNGVAVLHKGKNYKAEITEAGTRWSFDYTKSNSVVDKESAILNITNIRKRPGQW